jgi:TPR repeat protein
MRLISLALLAALAAPVAYGAPTQDDIAAARLAYIAGDYNDALKVIQEGADAGNAMALNILGAAYQDGHGVEQDTSKAVELFEQAAKAGEVRAFFNLGTLFAEGSEPFEIDRIRAAKEFQSAADQGYGPAMTALGRLQETAEPANHEQAAYWYEKGHKAGDVIGKTNLAHAYVKGRGREENWIRARVLYTEAASRGYPRAFNDLGVMHEEGYGVHMDQLTAYSFYLQGVKGNYPKAGKNIAQLIIKARFPWSSKHAALGYYIWAVRNASETEKTGFQEDCEKLVTEVNPDADMRARAERFADQL